MTEKSKIRPRCRWDGVAGGSRLLGQNFVGFNFEQRYVDLINAGLITLHNCDSTVRETGLSSFLS